MSNNNSIIQDSDGDYSDWIELYNKSSKSISLYHFSLSDRADKPRKWVFPEVSITGKGFLLVFASGKNKVTDNELHTNFKINNSGEPLIMSDDHDRVVSYVEPIYIPADKSYACIKDGSEKMTIIDIPTPNSSNNGSSGIFCSHQSGFYEDDIVLELVPPDENQKIYYTLNGEVPGIKSYLYSEPITIKSLRNQDFTISLIPTTPLSGESKLYEYLWKKPEKVFKSNIIRFAGFEDSIMKSMVYTKNYLVDRRIKKRYTMPVVAIVTDSSNLFDYNTGIYVPGRRFDEYGWDTWPEGNFFNRGEQWERDIHITYFKEDGSLAFETDAGMRIRGHTSSAMPQKSFTVYFRKEYGISEVDYPIFENSGTTKYKRLIFRNSGNDFKDTHFRDAFLQNLIGDLDLELQDFRAAVVFINGEYWGIHNIREKYDRFYFKNKFDIEEEQINILDFCGEAEQGNNEDYIELLDYVKTCDMEDSVCYAYVQEKIDIENFIDFQIAEIYFANYDWPCNNYKIWKDNSPGSKWRFLIHDLDVAFGFQDNSSYVINSMEHAAVKSNEWPHCECSNLIFRKLQGNQDFKDQFIDRFIYCLNNTFQTERVLKYIDDFESLYSSEIGEHIDRWSFPSSTRNWKWKINILREFAIERPCYMSEFIASFFELDDKRFECANKRVYTNFLQVFPNPSEGSFSILNNSTIDIAQGDIKIVSMLGQVVHYQQNITIRKHEEFKLPPLSLPSGLYVLIFWNKEISEQKRIIISSGISNE